MRDARASEWLIPETVTVAEGVDLGASDPAASDEGKRRCVAVRRAGGRCSAPAPAGGLLCNAHAGRLDASAGGHARARTLAGKRQEQEERDAAARLGTRGAIRAELARQAEAIRETVAGLARDAAAGDRKAASLLLGYLNQGLGAPVVQAGADAPPDASVPLERLSDAALRELAFGAGAEVGDLPAER